MNTADSAWMLISTALVLFMVPGLALFYGGLVGEKNVVAMMAESFAAIGLVSVVWAVVGYTLAFGTDHAGVIGGLGHVMLRASARHRARGIHTFPACCSWPTRECLRSSPPR